MWLDHCDHKAPRDQLSQAQNTLSFCIRSPILPAIVFHPIRLFSEYTFYHIEDGRFIYYLLELHNTETWRAFALEKVDYLCSLLSEKWKLEVIGVVSRSAENLKSCTFLYREIMETLEQQIISGGSALIDTYAMDMRRVLDQTWDLIEKDLNAAVKDGDLKAALNVSTSIFASIRKAPFNSKDLCF